MSVYVWIERGIDGWVDGWMDGWKDGWMDRSGNKLMIFQLDIFI